MRSALISIAVLLAVSSMVQTNVSSMGFTRSTDYYLSGIIVTTDKATYVCDEQVKTSVTLYSTNFTLTSYPVTVQVISPAGKIMFSGSKLTDSDGVARISLLLPVVCDVGVYTVTASGRASSNSINSAGKFSVTNSKDYLMLNFDRGWYAPGGSVKLTGRVVADCNFTLVNNQTVHLRVYGPDNFFASASTRATGASFMWDLKLRASAAVGVYQVVVYAPNSCQKKAFYGNAFFSVFSSSSLQPWTISVWLDKSSYGVGDQIRISGILTSGQYFSCQFKWPCTGNGTFPPVNVFVRVINANGIEVYSRTKNVGLGYYPPTYNFQEIFSGYVDKSYLNPGRYFVTAVASTEGYPIIRTATSFKVFSSLADFSLSVTPSMLSIVGASSRSVKLTIDPLYGFDSEVDLSASWVGKTPTDVTLDLYPTLNSTRSSGVWILTIIAGETAPDGGTYNLTVIGRDTSNLKRMSHNVEVRVQFTRCFIATATYGSPLSPPVQLLRGFRDNVLLRTFAGSSFMIIFNAWYYSFSPQVAHAMANNDEARVAMDFVLFPLLQVLTLSSGLFFSLNQVNAELAAIVTGFLASSLLATIYLTLPTAILLRRSIDLRRKIRRRMIIGLATSSCILLVAELASSAWLMVFTTSFFVLSTMTCVAIHNAELILRFTRPSLTRLQSLAVNHGQ